MLAICSSIQIPLRTRCAANTLLEASLIKLPHQTYTNKTAACSVHNHREMARRQGKGALAGKGPSDAQTGDKSPSPSQAATLLNCFGNENRQKRLAVAAVSSLMAAVCVALPNET